MKKSIVFVLFLSLSFLLTLSCEDKKEKDTTPPTVSILSPLNGSTNDEIVTIQVSSEDEKGILKVDFYINDSFIFSDETTPYEYEWDTEALEDGEYAIKVVSFDLSENITESQEISIKVDNNVTFVKSFGGGGRYLMHNVQQTSDEGYILTGEIDNDAFLAKIDKYGNTEWNQTFNGVGYKQGSSVQQTIDGGYIIVGLTSSFPDSGLIDSDVWLIKTDPLGNEEWNKTFGGEGKDWGDVVKQTADGGYIISGAFQPDGQKYEDVWLIKTDGSGSEEWNKRLGSTGYSSWRTSVQPTSDGGFVTYYSISFTADPWRYDDVILEKLTPGGEVEWSVLYSGPDDDWFFDIKETSDGGFIATGKMGDLEDHTWLVKIGNNGTMEWEKYLDGSTAGLSAMQTLDGGFIVSGYKYDSGMNFEINLIKTDFSGNEEWTKTFPGREGNAVQQTTDGGYIIAGKGASGLMLIKTDSEGNIEP